jgi:prepilin-type N-terminal cleavage/methylation domain-containing protein
MMNQPSRTVRHSGFTLVELLVVIAIIAVLIALTSGAVIGFITFQRGANTETTLRTVDKAFQQLWQKVIADAKKETPSDTVYAAAQNADGSSNPRRAQVMWVKLRLIEAFPASYAEINSCPPYTWPTAATPSIPSGMYKNNPRYFRTLNGRTSINPLTERSACLLMALQTNGALTADSLGTSVVDTDGDGLKEIVDGWGNAIALYRFPTPSPTCFVGKDLKKSNPAPKVPDPLDPEGTLQDATWPMQASFLTLCGLNPLFASSSQSFYIIPVIVSAGPDGQLGLDAQMTDDGNLANDNVFSYRLKLGARGD